MSKRKSCRVAAGVIEGAVVRPSNIALEILASSSIVAAKMSASRQYAVISKSSYRSPISSASSAQRRLETVAIKCMRLVKLSAVGVAARHIVIKKWGIMADWR
jgi:hypothetical protein